MPDSATRDDPYRPLKTSVDLLGRLLGQVIAEAHGSELLDTVEHIRQLAKSSREGAPQNRQALIDYLQQLPDDKLVLVAQAFNQFLNLANIAEQLYSTFNPENQESLALSTLGPQLQQLLHAGVSRDELIATVDKLNIDLVLTAHPTEITRRTLIEKQNRIYYCLLELESHKNEGEARNQTLDRLAQLIAQWWHTDEIRTEKPTPVEEAVWGFAVIENALWDAVPEFLNHLEQTVARELDHQLPITFAPIRFASWMGGDRDGNPNVTSHITRDVILLARWKAADLFLRDINNLMSELSMNACSPRLRERAGDVREPYRAVLKELRSLLGNTLQTTDDLLKGREPPSHPVLENNAQLWDPLYDCYQSLHECRMGVIADGHLRDTLRRIQCFGSHLLRLDIRQESDRHTQVLVELCAYLELGDYAAWDEEQRSAFLSRELASKRPLLPRRWEPSDAVREVLDTFAMLAHQPPQALGAYIISMARAPSDVLAVQLLLQEFNCPRLPIAPLFETLDDLDHAAAVVERLLALPAYRDTIDDRQMIMIGYSDSAKDAGVMAAGWAQYRAQEALLQTCKRAGVHLTLFHGRGGTIGRGGAPAHAALLSQPPGSLENGLRVTEQGEMIRFKLGLPQTAVTTLGLYTGALLQSNLAPPPEPQARWREIVGELAAISAQAYRQLVFHDEHFLDYFRSATPINELSNLPLGSRPARRKADGGVESLRAIPWSFAWSQNRLMLPAWYGAGQALEQVIDAGKREELEAMCQRWPFFSARLSLLEMVYAKTDAGLSAYYDARLVPPRWQPLGETLRARLAQDIQIVLSIANETGLLQGLPWLKESVHLRNTYIDPLNLLQAELLSRDRASASDVVEQALMVTIGGIAAGLRNTG